MTKKPGMMTERMIGITEGMRRERERMAAEKPKIVIKVNDQANLAAEALLTFMVKQDFLNDAEIEAIVRWIIDQEPYSDGAAERKFFEAARAFMLEKQKEMEG